MIQVKSGAAINRLHRMCFTMVYLSLQILHEFIDVQIQRTAKVYGQCEADFTLAGFNECS